MSELNEHEISRINAALVEIGIDYETPRSEMARRIINQMSWVSSYSRCLDGLELDYNVGIEHCRSPQDIRRIVEHLQEIVTKATIGKCKCDGCGKEVFNAWRDDDTGKKLCLTCLAGERDKWRDQAMLTNLTPKQ